VRVINAGIGGTSTPGRLPAFEQEVLSHRPDVVTLEFINDMGIPRDDMQARYTEILRRVHAAGATLLLITPHFSMPAWMGLPHSRGGETRPNVTFLREFAAANGLPLADASKRWEQLDGEGVPYETLLRNGINHPEDHGHRIFAEEVLRLFPAE
jgi:lysophospholipase L1-like esterase